MKLPQRPDGKGSRFVVSVPERHVDEVEQIVSDLEAATRESSSRIVLDALRMYHTKIVQRERRMGRLESSRGSGDLARGIKP